MTRTRFSFLAAALLTALTFAGCASTADAQHADSAAKDGIAHLSWSQVQEATNAGAILVDARGADSFAAGHIAGAVNIPSASTDPNTWAKLPSDKSTKVITYCGGPACSASLKAAKKAMEMGYTDVAEYKGGYPEWKKAQAN